MSSTTVSRCPKCDSPTLPSMRFCASCGVALAAAYFAPTETAPIAIPRPTDGLAERLARATIGEYEIRRELSGGGMGAVFLAEDLSLGRKVAIKTMLPSLTSRSDLVERFKREAQTAARLNHPNIIQIYTVRQTNDLAFFVMKFVEGRGLDGVVAELGALPVEMVQLVLAQTASALAYAHRKGVIHRDIKPANIMLDEEGRVVVTDFGIAKVQELGQSLTATGAAIGTPAYMCPEQIHGQPVTGLSDQYSLGIVAHEMLTGTKPFNGSTYAELVAQHLFEPAPDVREMRPDVPKRVAGAIHRMLSKDPRQRFENLDAAAAAFGSPDKTRIEQAERDLRALASGQRPARLPVPMSPIPISRKSSLPPQPKAEPPEPPRAVVREPKPLAPSTLAPRTGVFHRPAILGGVAVLAAVSVGAWMILKSDPTPPTTDNTEQRQPSVQQAAKEPVAPPKAAAASSKSTATTTVRLGRVIITNAPATARLRVDGRLLNGDRLSSAQGVTRTTLTLSAGRHVITVDVSGYETFTREIRLAAGDEVVIAYSPVVARAPAVAESPVPRPQVPALTPADSQAVSQVGTLQILLSPWGVVTIDGVSRGDRDRHSERISAGTHHIQVTRDGYVTRDTSIVIKAGATSRIEWTLVRRP